MNSKEPMDIEISDVLDLHSFAPSDVKRALIAYLDEAMRLEFKRVRIIHGKGIGVQREIVRGVLAETDFVQSFRNADEFSGGGSGATVVILKKTKI